MFIRKGVCMEVEERKKSGKKKRQILLFVIIFIILGVFSFFILNEYSKSKKNISMDKNKNEISYKDFIYKIRYDFGCEGYIYLLENQVIKTVEIQPIYELCEYTDCYNFTGKYDYIENTVHFSKEAVDKVIQVFDELYKKSGKKEFSADAMELTKRQQRLLLAVMTNDEDKITVEDDIDYEIVREKFTNKTKTIENTKMVLNTSTKNAMLNKIAEYLNAIVDKDFEQLSKNSKSLIESTDEENLGIHLTLDLVYAGPYSLSFIYTKDGKLENTIHDVKGYSFYYTGDIHEFDMNGWKDSYYQKALAYFMKDDCYLKHKDQFNKDWQTILYDHMFLTGNWYLEDGKLTFVIPAYLFGFDKDATNIITIRIDLEEEF